MTHAAPDRSLTQRLSALDRANAIRTHRAELKRDLKAGRIRLADVILEGGDLVATMKVYDVLVAIPRVGGTKALRVLNAAHISPRKNVGGLTSRQRLELFPALRACAPTVNPQHFKPTT